MIDASYMCDRHLLGEHVECHMFAGCIDRHKSVAGYVRNNLFDAASLTERHNKLAREMKSRGFLHKSPISKYTGESTPVNVQRSLDDLINRCERCRKRYESSIKR